ncbi:hypothetical protein ABFS83_14G170500 [Erythranthe nasuta]
MEDTLEKFFPPPPKAKCPQELQEKFIKFIIDLESTAGRRFNQNLRKRKEFRNPNFLQQVVASQKIDEIGSCFGKSVFDVLHI